MIYRRKHLASLFRKAAGLPVTILFCLLCISHTGQALPFITATYQHASGNELSIRIEVGSPPPSSLILIQKLPPGTNLLQSSPPAQKINPATGEAKWLFRKLKPGIMTVSFSLDREVAAQEISGQIRFKSSHSEDMESLPVSKP